MTASDKNKIKLYPDRRKDDMSTYFHRQLIGGVGLLMPVLLWLIAGGRPTGDRPWELLGSVSAYYYSGAVSVFAGMLISLALFLFSYSGYSNRYNRLDRVLAGIAAMAAILVSLFPTAAPNELLALPWWTPLIGVIHFIFATVLFTCFIVFSVFLFPQSNVTKVRDLPRDKKVRNVIYYICGAAMTGCMLWAFYAQNTGASIFWPEVLALEFFGVSWLLKGRADWTAMAIGRRSLYFAAHPRQLVKEAGMVVRGQQVTSQPKASKNRAR
jgi:hypothetical protein